MLKAVADPNYLGFRKFYQILIDKSGPVIAEMMRVFTDATNFPVLFHCMHGKDRAGILCCLLSMLAGVEQEVNLLSLDVTAVSKMRFRPSVKTTLHLSCNSKRRRICTGFLSKIL